jgi:hypothetical protein
MDAEQNIAKEHRGLLDIDEVQPFDPEKDQPIFDEIRQVLARHNALHRFGVTLLHKHFDVYEGERMVEMSDPETRTLEIRPRPEKLGLNETYIQTNWRFDSQISSTQLCFADCLRSGGGKHHEIHKKK